MCAVDDFAILLRDVYDILNSFFYFCLVRRRLFSLHVSREIFVPLFT